MKKIIFILSLFSCLSIAAHAEDDKTVTLTVSGTGATKEVATQNALRSAIEQAFGAFISSKTEVLNDSLVKDEIVSVTNGNIQKYAIVSEVQIPEGGIAITLKAMVSVTKLTSFCESKGVTIEYKGGIFAANMKMQKLNEESEYKTIINLCNTSWEILSKSVDFELQSAKQPILRDKEKQMYSLGFLVTAKTNKNKESFYKYFNEVVSKVSINSDDLEMYKSSKISFYSFRIEDSKGNLKNVYLRNKLSLLAIKNLVYKANLFYFNFLIETNIDSILIGKLDYYDIGIIVSGLPNQGFRDKEYDISGYLTMIDSKDKESQKQKYSYLRPRITSFLPIDASIISVSKNYDKEDDRVCAFHNNQQLTYYLETINSFISNPTNYIRVVDKLFDYKYLWITPYWPSVKESGGYIWWNVELENGQTDWKEDKFLFYDKCFNSDLYTINKYQESSIKIYIEKQYKLEDVEKLSTFKINTQ